MRAEQSRPALQICSREDPRAYNRRGIRVPLDCPLEVYTLIDKMLREDPRERPTAGCVLDTLLALDDPRNGGPGPLNKGAQKLRLSQG